MFNIMTRFDRWPANQLAIFIVFSICLVTSLDFFTGYKLAFSLFYLVPVTLTGYRFGLKKGVSMAFFCAICWQASNFMAGEEYESFGLTIWNTSSRLGFYLFTVILVCDLKEALTKEQQLVRTDPLTGSQNRMAFYEELAQEMNRARRFGYATTIVYFDLDKFKAINDTLGHQVGDELLCEVVNVLKSKLRVTDRVVRLGGDEFTLLLPQTDDASAQFLLPNLKTTLNEAMQRKQWDVTPSMGVLTCTEACEVSAIIHRADELMYEAKREGGNAIRYATLP